MYSYNKTPVSFGCRCEKSQTKETEQTVINPGNLEMPSAKNK